MANHTRMSSRPEKWRRGSTNFKKIEPCQEIVEQAANETVYREDACTLSSKKKDW